MATGKVYVLSREEIEENEDRRAVLAQMLIGSELLLILKEAMEAVEKLEFPLNWPNKHYDKQSTLNALTDLMPDQTILGMELEAEVRRAEIKATERMG